MLIPAFSNKITNVTSKTRLRRLLIRQLVQEGGSWGGVASSSVFLTQVEEIVSRDTSPICAWGRGPQTEPAEALPGVFSMTGGLSPFVAVWMTQYKHREGN